MPLSWEIWLDVHISPIIAKWLEEYTGFTAKSAYTLSFYTLDDREIFQKAKEQGNVILISKDTDFPDLISRLGSPPKLINVKIGNCDNRTLWSTLKPNIKEAIYLLTESDIDIVELDWPKLHVTALIHQIPTSVSLRQPTRNDGKIA